MPDLSDTSQGQPIRGFGAVLLTLGGIFAAFGVASCCGLPLTLATLGLGTAWLGGFALLAAPHRLGLLVAATVSLVTAAILLWRQRAAVCASGAICAHPEIRGAIAIGLLIGFALLCLGFAYA